MTWRILLAVVALSFAMTCAALAVDRAAWGFAVPWLAWFAVAAIIDEAVRRARR